MLCLETSNCNNTQQQLFLFVVGERAMGRLMSAAQEEAVTVPSGTNSELSISPSCLLCLQGGQQLWCLPASSHQCEVLPVEVTICCCHYHVNVLGNWGSCSHPNTVFGAVGLAGESICSKKGEDQHSSLPHSLSSPSLSCWCPETLLFSGYGGVLSTT